MYLSFTEICSGHKKALETRAFYKLLYCNDLFWAVHGLNRRPSGCKPTEKFISFYNSSHQSGQEFG